MEVKMERENMKAEFDSKKDEIKAERDAKKDEFKAEIKANKEEFKMERKEFKEEWKRTATRTPEELKAKIEEMKASMKDRRAEIRARLASSTQEIKARFDEVKKERVKERIANVSGKFDGAIVRMESFDTKVSAAIARFKERGVDTTNSEALLSAARAGLADVKTNAAAFEAKATTIVEGDEVSRLALKEEAEVVIQSIKDTHADYVAVVVELRASGGLESEQENEQESENESETEVEAETSTQ
jgi:hypothetical protein